MIVLRIVPICKRIHKAMYICICKAVTDREIRGAVSLGSVTLQDLRRDLGIASCCGKCAPDARRIIGECTRECAAGCGMSASFAAGD
jgi:bacterioferritin-associated ferredoxin